MATACFDGISTNGRAAGAGDDGVAVGEVVRHGDLRGVGKGEMGKGK